MEIKFKVNLKIIKKLLISITHLWILLGGIVFSFAAQEIYWSHQKISNRGALYKSAFDKIVTEESTATLTEEEAEIILKYFKASFNLEYSSASIQEIISVELDSKYFFGRYVYTSPVVLILTLILLWSAPYILYFLLKHWLKWLVVD